MISEINVVKSVRDFLIDEKGYIVWVDSKFAAKNPGLEPTHQIRIGGRIPDILARKRKNLIAVECKGEREGGRQLLEAVGQVMYYKRASHNQYIGCPDSLVDDIVRGICEYLNVGLLVVSTKLEVEEELEPGETLLDEEFLDAILELLALDVDVKPVPNLSFSRPEPFIIATLMTGKTNSYGDLLSSLMNLLPSRSSIGCSEGFAKKVIDAAISLGLVRKKGNNIFLTPEGSSILSYFTEKCENTEKAMYEILALYRPKLYDYKPTSVTKSDIRFVSRYSLLRHPTIDFLASLLIEMKEKYGRNYFTFGEILKFAKDVYPGKNNALPNQGIL